jgi:hypothetical protein
VVQGARILRRILYLAVVVFVIDLRTLQSRLALLDFARSILQYYVVPLKYSGTTLYSIIVCTTREFECMDETKEAIMTIAFELRHSSLSAFHPDFIHSTALE